MLSLAAGWERFGQCVVLLAGCAIAVPFVVLLQNGITEGPLRQRMDQAFDAFDEEWRRFTEAIRRRRAVEAVRGLRVAISALFRWQNLTGIGRVGTAVVKLLTIISVVFLLIHLVVLLLARL